MIIFHGFGHFDLVDGLVILFFLFYNNNNLFLTHKNTIKVLKCGVKIIKYTQKKQNIQKMKSNDNR